MDTTDKAGKEAAKNYNRKAEDFAKTDKGEKAAEEARRAVEGSEGPALREAERRGRAPAKGVK